MGATGNPVFSGALIALSMAWAPAWLIPFLGAGLWATGSRAAMLAAAAVIAWRLWEKQERRPFIIGLAALGLFAVLQVRRPGSDRAHVAIALAAMRAWRLHPLLGWGPAAGAIAYIRTQDNETMRLMSGMICKHTHNLITNIAVTQGALGLAAWTILCGAAWRVASRISRGALISVGVFGMFEPIPLMAYVVLAIAVGMDASPINAPPRRGWSSLLPAAACLFAFLTWEMVAERYCLLGRVDIAASMCPWEFAYCEYDVAHAMQSARLHRGNPMAYFGPVELLRKAGQFKYAEVLVRIENRMDPLKLLQ